MAFRLSTTSTLLRIVILDLVLAPPQRDLSALPHLGRNSTSSSFATDSLSHEMHIFGITQGGGQPSSLTVVIRHRSQFELFSHSGLSPNKEKACICN
ncbi:hypothetical protein IE53DRAFT_384569 [Violaceomyces palustris]|uniref:Uncharacterized protein n=1 Tax=Violaceomyces palustris TaxID=1673888 RepID=A0ACD0P4I0_9BASI|nr:hypothetical protein IE53DRAFT_384569 [Violaceomyces palustris]